MWGTGITVLLILFLLIILLYNDKEGFDVALMDTNAPAATGKPVSDITVDTQLPAIIPSNFSDASGPAPAPVSYSFTNMSPFDLRLRQEQTSSIKNMISDYSLFKPATEDRISSTENNVGDVISNIKALKLSQKANELKVKGLQLAVSGYQVPKDFQYISAPGLVRPANSGSDKQTYPAAAPLDPTALEEYVHDLIESMIKNGTDMSGP